ESFGDVGHRRTRRVADLIAEFEISTDDWPVENCVDFGSERRRELKTGQFAIVPDAHAPESSMPRASERRMPLTKPPGGVGARTGTNATRTRSDLIARPRAGITARLRGPDPTRSRGREPGSRRGC